MKTIVLSREREISEMRHKVFFIILLLNLIWQRRILVELHNISCISSFDILLNICLLKTHHSVQFLGGNSVFEVHILH